MKIQQEIESLELKYVALGKVQDELGAQLEKIKAQSQKPVAPARRNLKEKRVQMIADFYMRRKINKGSKKLK